MKLSGMFDKAKELGKKSLKATKDFKDIQKLKINLINELIEKRKSGEVIAIDGLGEKLDVIITTESSFNDSRNEVSAIFSKKAEGEVLAIGDKETELKQNVVEAIK